MTTVYALTTIKQRRGRASPALPCPRPQMVGTNRFHISALTLLEPSVVRLLPGLDRPRSGRVVGDHLVRAPRCVPDRRHGRSVVSQMPQRRPREVSAFLARAEASRSLVPSTSPMTRSKAASVIASLIIRSLPVLRANTSQGDPEPYRRFTSVSFQESAQGGPGSGDEQVIVMTL